MKTGTVKEVTANGTWDRPEGTLYKFEYIMEDGSSLTANHKTSSAPFKAGDAVEYEIKGSNSYGAWGRVQKVGGYQPRTGGRAQDPETQARIERSWAIGQAVNILGPVKAVNVDSMKQYMTELCRVADVVLKARDTFPKFEADEVVRSYWESQMAPEGDLPF